MEDISTDIILPPNKQMDVTFEFSETPHLYDYILFLDFNRKGNCIVGCSDLSGTFWEGTMLFFKDTENLIKHNHSKHYIHMTSSDGKFVNDDTVAIAEDTGILNILSIDDSPTLKPMNYFRHARKISEVAIWNNSSNVLTCSGRSLSIWDVNSNEKRPVSCFDSIHLDTVNSVDTQKACQNIFVSASSDRKACLWDLRAEKTPTVLYTNEFSSLTRIASSPKDSNCFAVSTRAGDVYIVDKRQPGEFISTFYCFDKPVGCLAFNEANHIAVSGDINIVLVLNLQENGLSEIYRNVKHEGHVKDLKWYNNVLYSCGFGTKLIKHEL